MAKKTKKPATNGLVDLSGVEFYNHPHGPLPPLAKASCAGGPVKYRLGQIEQGGVWTSIVFEAPTTHHVWQAVVAGYLSGHARWAEDLDGLILCGIDPRGNRLYTEPHKGGNLTALRTWHLENVGTYA